VVYSGFWWLLWFIVALHRFMVVYGGLLWFIVVYCGYGGLWWFILVYGVLCLFMMVYVFVYNDLLWL